MVPFQPTSDVRCSAASASPARVVTAAAVAVAADAAVTAAAVATAAVAAATVAVVATAAVVAVDARSVRRPRPARAKGRTTGSVKWFHDAQGFGFIQTDAGEDVFALLRDHG